MNRGSWSEPVYDKAEKKWARYRKYEDQQGYWDDYAGLIKRRYKGAIGRQDTRDFASEMKRGGYATDPDYVKKIESAEATARRLYGARIAPPPPAAPSAQAPVAGPQGMGNVSAAGVPQINVSQTTNISVSGASDANATATAIAMQQDRVNSGVARNLRGVMILLSCLSGSEPS